jgi:hypothetical protein
MNGRETAPREELGPRVQCDDLEVAEEGREDLLETRLTRQATAQVGLDLKHAFLLGLRREHCFHGFLARGCAGVSTFCVAGSKYYKFLFGGKNK